MNKTALRNYQIGPAANRKRSLDDLKDDFLSSVAHEFRSPLSALKGYLELMGKQREQLSLRHQGYLKVMEQSAERLGQFIDNVLDLAKLNAGLMAFSTEPVEVKALFEGVVHGAWEALSAHRFQVRVRVPEGLCVMADPLQLQQILNHLLSNAIKFTPDGGVLTLWAKAGEPGRVQMGMTDTGIGIPRDKWEKVFLKFEQVEETKNKVRKTNGTGLGMTIVRGLVETQGGRIWIQESSGRGTTVSWTLPRPRRPSAVVRTRWPQTARAA